MTAPPSLPALTVAGLARGLARGEYSSVELTRACLDRIAVGQPALNAFVTVTAESALASAAAADAGDGAGAAGRTGGVGRLRRGEGRLGGDRHERVEGGLAGGDPREAGAGEFQAGVLAPGEAAGESGDGRGRQGRQGRRGGHSITFGTR